MNNYLDLKNIKAFSEYSKLEEAGQIIRNGGLVLFPTETVYGLGANGLNSEAVKNIYVAKGRSSDNPLILHISDIEMIGKIAKDISDVEFKLMNAFWPGPFTIILNKTDAVPSVVAGGLDTVGVRMPNNEIAKNLIKYADVPIAAPSANISGRPSGTNVEDIDQELKDRVDYIIDGGECQIGVESTVVRVIDGIPHILRPGKITAEEIKEVAGSVIIDKHILGKLDANEKVMSPGMKYKHYAPKGDLVIVEGKKQAVAETINHLTKMDAEAGLKTAVIASDENLSLYDADCKINIGSREHEESIAANLYEVLREMDEMGVQKMYSESFAGGGLGAAIMNRLLKAAGHHVIRV